MKYLLTIFAAILLLGISITASAQITLPGPMPDRPVIITQGGGSAFTAIDITGTVVTDAIFTKGYRFLTYEIDYTHTDASAATMTCASSDASAGTYRNIQGLVYSGTSTGDSDTLTWSQAVSGAESWTWTVPLNGYYYLKCSFDSDGTADNDITLASKIGI